MGKPWGEVRAVAGWASRPITQNGVVRITSQAGYPIARPAAQVAQRLELDLLSAIDHPTGADCLTDMDPRSKPGMTGWAAGMTMRVVGGR